MKNWKRKLIGSGIFLVVFVVALLGLSLIFMDFVVDCMWFNALHYEGYFWLRLTYKYIVFTAATLLFFAIFFFNFWVASRYLGASVPETSKKEKGTGKAPKDIIKMFRSGSLKLYTPLSLVMSIAVSFPLYRKWESVLFYVFGGKVGVPDPIYGKDVAYYLFSFPIYLLLQHRLLIAFLILFGALLFLYWLEHRLLSGENLHLPRGAKIHLSFLIMLIILIQDWGYILQRYELLYSTTHETLFFGPGFVEMWIILPLIWLCLLLFMIMAFYFVRFIHTKKGLKFVVLFTALFIIATVARHSSFLTNAVEKFIVKPNEITKEAPFIASNIKATLAAYKLDQVKIKDFHTQQIPWTVTPKIEKGIQNIPVWDREVLDEVYKELQGIRPYYNFKAVNVDRYAVENQYQQIYVSAREIDTIKLPDYAQNWINTHLQYTHGNGAVMTPAAQAGDEFMVWFIQDIPPASRYGFTIKQPGIYYGIGKYSYALAPNSVGEFDYPTGNTNVMSNYGGTGGVPFSSLFRKLLFSVYFHDKNIFFTTKTTDKSRILIKRNILNRIRTLTPFFLLDSDPYVVITPEKFYWIEDAYTTTDMYPDSEYYNAFFNYIRNSVKIVVDAYNGSVTYYIADPSDPITQAYRRMYPGLLKSMDEMPDEIKKHIRYPRDFLRIQMSIYAKYHQTNPELFYRQEDIWGFSKIYRHKKSLNINPYFLTLNLFRPAQPEFLLILPMSPINRDNSRALVVGRCDGDHYGEIVVYSFSTEKQVYGPSQIDALIDQNTSIAKQFALWNQKGSQVIRGRMIVLPVGQVLLYIEPVYLKATETLNIPQLKRLIVSQGDAVVMEPSLEAAFRKMEKKLESRTEWMKKRFPVNVPKKPEEHKIKTP